MTAKISRPTQTQTDQKAIQKREKRSEREDSNPSPRDLAPGVVRPRDRTIRRFVKIDKTHLTEIMVGARGFEPPTPSPPD